MNYLLTALMMFAIMVAACGEVEDTGTDADNYPHAEDPACKPDVPETCNEATKMFCNVSIGNYTCQYCDPEALYRTPEGWQSCDTCGTEKGTYYSLSTSLEECSGEWRENPCQ